MSYLETLQQIRVVTNYIMASTGNRSSSTTSRGQVSSAIRKSSGNSRSSNTLKHSERSKDARSKRMSAQQLLEIVESHLPEILEAEAERQKQEKDRNGQRLQSLQKDVILAQEKVNELIEQKTKIERDLDMAYEKLWDLRDGVQALEIELETVHSFEEDKLRAIHKVMERFPDKCAICLEPGNGELVPTPCNHYFHSKCLAGIHWSPVSVADQNDLAKYQNWPHVKLYSQFKVIRCPCCNGVLQVSPLENSDSLRPHSPPPSGYNRPPTPSYSPTPLSYNPSADFDPSYDSNDEQ